MHTADLDYDLPPDLIAARPADRRDAARLLLARLDLPPDSPAEHHLVADLPGLLRPGDLLILNDTRVIPARFHAARSATAGRVEGLYLDSPDPATWRVMLQSGGRLQPGERITLADDAQLELLDKDGEGIWTARLHAAHPTDTILHRIGRMPIPPYIRKARCADEDRELTDGWADLDRDRYQTVFADRPGAVAAPTAGLHFTPDLLDRLAAAAIQIARLTLHVGLGTFAPVRVDDLTDHPMHAEHFTIPAATLAALRAARSEHRRVIAVGTTVVRALESLPDRALSTGPLTDYAGSTSLLIQPPYHFRFVDGLLTNFHLPRSTLLALVAALTSLDRLKHLYRQAVEHRYRFFSYGDAMLILPPDPPAHRE